MCLTKERAVSTYMFRRHWAMFTDMAKAEQGPIVMGIQLVNTANGGCNLKLITYGVVFPLAAKKAYFTPNSGQAMSILK